MSLLPKLFKSTALLCLLALVSQAASPFQVKIQTGDDYPVYRSGDAITWNISLAYPKDYQASSWRVIAPGYGVPENFLDLMKVPKAKRPAKPDASSPLSSQQWLQGSQRNASQLTCTLPIKPLPPGNYRLALRFRFDPIAKQSKLPIRLMDGACNFIVTPKTPTSTPTLDGNPDDPCWTTMPWTTNYRILGTDKPAKVQTRHKVFSDGKQLYFLVDCDEPLMERLVADPGRSGSNLWRNDTLELKLCADQGFYHFYKVIVDPNGTVASNHFVDNNTGVRKYSTIDRWDASCRAAVKRNARSWTVEAAIPLGSMDYLPSQSILWRVDIGRNRYTGGQTELSSGAVYSTANHCLGWEYPEFPITFNRNDFNLVINHLKRNTTLNASEQLVFNTSASVFNPTVAARCMTVRSSLRFPDTGTVAASGQQNLAMDGKDIKHISLNVTCPKPGHYIQYLEFWTAGPNPALIRRIREKVLVAYTPFKISVLRPAYRNNLYATMKDKTIEARITRQTSSQVPVAVQLKDENGKLFLQKTMPANQQELHLTLDGNSLPDGRYFLIASGSVNGLAVSSKQQIRKLPYQRGEVFLDARGVTHVDGQPFIPMGWYCLQKNKTMGPAENAFVAHSMSASSREDFNAQLNTLWGTGRKGIIRPYQELLGRGRDRDFAYSKQSLGITPQQISTFKKHIPILSKHPGILAWQMADEPEASSRSPEWLRQAKEWLTELDPYHPCTLTNFSTEGMKRFADSCDILMPDCYPGYFENGHRIKDLDETTSRGKTAKALNKPAWIILPACLFPSRSTKDPSIKGVPPTYQELRKQLYEAIIQDMRGFLFYAPQDGLRESVFIVGLPIMTAEINALKPFILQDSQAVGTVTTIPQVKNFFTAMKADGARRMVIAVNATDHDLKATFKLRDASVTTLYDEGARRTITLSNGTFQDTFKSLETKVYLTSRETAAQLIHPAEVTRRVDDFRRNRKKPGNLLAMGEMLRADQEDYFKHPDQRPKDIVDVRVSSESVHYYASDTGSTYFLVDGIPLPSREEFCWRPRTNDKAPWVLFTIPQTAKVSRAVIYTPCGNATRLRVRTDSRTYDIDNTARQEKVILDLQGESTRTLKVEIMDYKIFNLHYDMSGTGTSSHVGLLSEVELYGTPCP